LKDSHLIKNVKGKKSGYILTKKSDEIKTIDIFQVFDKELTENHCFSKGKLCDRYYLCATRIFWKDFNDNIMGYLNKVTLKELAFQQTKLDTNREKTYDYCI
jgi:Rrf2 family protein